jgi:hypothetical protein
MSNHGHEYQFIMWKSQRVDGGRTYISGVELAWRLIM